MHNYLTELPRRQAVKDGFREAFSYTDQASGKWTSCSWREFARKVDLVACALETLDIEPCDSVAIYSANSPEILISDFACYRNRAIPVSLYSTSSPSQVEFILRDCNARMVMVGDENQLETIKEVRHNCPELKYIVSFFNKHENIDGLMSFDDLLKLGQATEPKAISVVNQRSADATPNDIATLIYTSGTTGEPKGAILNHSCFDAAIEIHLERLDMLSEQDTSLCFLPLSHIFEKAWTYFCLVNRMRVAINRNPKEIQQTIKAIRPTCMCSVPRFWEKAYTAIQDKLASAGTIRKTFINRALAIGRRRNLDYIRRGLPVPAWLEARYKFYDKKVLSTIRRAIGVDNGNIFPTAGAPLSPNIVEFFHSCGINILIGYGLSETTATVSCFPDFNFETGSVGTPMPRVQVRIGADNEIQVKAPTVMQGYFGRPEATAEAFTDDGWFRTGDAGYIDSSGAIVLTDRIKDLFKTSNGKYIAPQALESRLGEDRYIEQVAVIGDRRKYVTAIIIPAFEALKEYARKKKIEFRSIEDLIQNSEIIRMLQERIDRLQKNFANFERIKKFTLLPREFSIETGELTNTLKLRRRIINNLYSDQIEAMYAAS
ncbi:MAG: long-chain fatty acid--CoA ligase [Muribaculaceae bacterium]|nr:long-chain fatty acid--CoA ligase [Muribaculaceae bacterium]